MKKLLAFLSIVLLISLLTACGGSDDVSTKNKDNDETNQEQTSGDDKSKDKSEDKSKNEPKVGTRSNPVKMSQVASIKTESYDADHNAYKTTIDLSVEEVIRGDEAESRLKEMSRFNEDAPEGYEWILVEAKVKVADSETEDYPFNIRSYDFDFVSESGDVYSGNIYPTVEPEIRYEMYKGNEKEGYTAGLVKEGEEATMKFQSIASDAVFFELEVEEDEDEEDVDEEDEENDDVDEEDVDEEDEE